MCTLVSKVLISGTEKYKKPSNEKKLLNRFLNIYFSKSAKRVCENNEIKMTFPKSNCTKLLL